MIPIHSHISPYLAKYTPLPADAAASEKLHVETSAVEANGSQTLSWYTIFHASSLNIILTHL